MIKPLIDKILETNQARMTSMRLSISPQQSVKKRSAGLFRSTMIITFFSFLNFLAGFALQMVLAARFGAKWEMDAYLAANTIPTLLTGVLLGSLRITFVPVFIEYEVRKDTAEAWKVASSFINITTVVMSSIVLLGIFGGFWLIRLTVPGFAVGTVVFNSAVELSRILFPSIIFNGLGALLSSIYFSHHRFLLPAIAPLVKNLVIVGSAIVLSSTIGIRSVAVGTIMGSVMQFIILIPIMLGKYQFSWNYRHPGVIQIIKLILPWVAGALIYKANPLVDRFIASSFPEGSISYLGYALKLTTVASTLATTGISTTFFPLMSRYAAEGNLAEFKRNISTGIRMILLVVMPIIVGIVILRIPFIQLLFERGQFTHQDTIATASVWVCYLGALFALSIGNIVSFAFYALQDTLTPAKVGVVGMFINTVLAFVSSRYISFRGPALAYSVMAIINLSVLGLILRSKLEGIDGRNIVTSWIKISTAAMMMGGGIWWLKSRLDPSHLDGVYQMLVNLGLVVLGVGIYTCFIYLFKVREGQIIFKKFIQVWCVQREPRSHIKRT
jgi:putative peptidoglycan lipid II flippase